MDDDPSPFALFDVNMKLVSYKSAVVDGIKINMKEEHDGHGQNRQKEPS
jgi:hypothetical protein